MRSRFHFSIPVALLSAMVFHSIGNQILFAQTLDYYRVVVVVTPAAYNLIGSEQLRTRINNRIIDNTNLCYSKSPDTARVELAGIITYNYTESQYGIRSDILNLQNFGNDGNNIIYKLRHLYIADVVTMVVSNAGYSNGSGQAGYGFVNVYPTLGEWYNYSCLNYDAISLVPCAAHEIGHNFGCQHDTLHTSEMDWPETYSHGYIPPSNTWGTVMSYPADWRNYQNFFSNPDSTFNNETRGTAYRCNNTRMINEHAHRMMATLNPTGSVSVFANTWKANEYGDIISLDSIQIGAPDSLMDSSEVLLRAAQKVSITSGFYVGNKAKLTINAGQGTYLGKKRSTPPRKNDGASVLAEKISFDLFRAIRAQAVLKIYFSLPQATPITFSIYDLSGKLVFSKLHKIQKSGYQTAAISMRNLLGRSIYILKIATFHTSKQIKITGL